MRKTVTRLTLCAMLCALCAIAEAQQPKKVPRIGYLTGSSPSAIAERTEAFRQGLRDLGYVEGKDIVIEYRYAEGKLERLPTLVSELVRLKVDVIVTGGPAATRPAKEATATIPIVMAGVNDPVGNGFVASLARPGGNITGLATLGPEISGKHLELLKETVPKLSRVAVLGTSTVSGYSQTITEIERAAKAFSVELQYLDVLDSKSIETALRAANKGRAEAILTLQGPILFSQRKEIVDLAIKSRLPAIFHTREFVEAGGLMSYAPSSTDLFRRAATFVDKILKGAKPADLPVEQPIKFEFIINLKAAKQIGLTIPPNVLARADRGLSEYRYEAPGNGRKKNSLLCFMRFALCAWLARRGAAAEEDREDRVPSSEHSSGCSASS
jgi:putative ABC transport system substrate-binding protein